MSFHSALKFLLWGAFNAGAKWALDATEKKGEREPRAAFEAFFEENRDTNLLAEITPSEGLMVGTRETPDAEAP